MDVSYRFNIGDRVFINSTESCGLPDNSTEELEGDIGTITSIKDHKIYGAPAYEVNTDNHGNYWWVYDAQCESLFALDDILPNQDGLAALFG